MSDSLTLPSALPGELYARTSKPLSLAGTDGALNSEAQINKVAEEFESVFLSQMLEHMFEGTEQDALFGDKETNEIYRGLMIEEYGKVMAKAGGIGLADYVKQELLHLQEIGGLKV